MTEPVLVEVPATDRAMLDRIGRLRVRAWETEVGRVEGLDCWLDLVDEVGRHWAFLVGGEPVAAARISIHPTIQDVPDPESYAPVLRESPPGPIGSFNRLVVAREYRGHGLGSRLDIIRLAAAEAAGCRSVVGATASGDRRINQLTRLGFRVVGVGDRANHPVLARMPAPLVLLHRLGTDGCQPSDRPAAKSGVVLSPTRNQMGWTTDVLNQVSIEFVAAASGEYSPVLDLGAAYGVATLPALERGATVYANDVSAEHLAELQQRVPPGHRTHLRLVPGRFPNELDFPDGQFTAIHASQVLHFLRPQEVVDGLGKSFRWLRPGGRLYILAATPFQATHAAFVPAFLERKRRGDSWPGLIEDYQAYNAHWSAALNPGWLHTFDADVLSAAVERAGFVVERAAMFPRTGLPDFVRFDGREHVGLIAHKPGPRASPAEPGLTPTSVRPPAPGVITVDWADHFTPEIERLRRESFPPTGRPTSEDEFDAVSRFVVARADGRLVGAVRVTRTPPSPETAWAVYPSLTPTGPGYVELTRGCVAAAARGLGVYRLMMTELVCHLAADGVPAAVALIEPDFPARQVLWDLGFERWGPVTPARHPEKGVAPHQYIVHRLARSGADLVGRRKAVREALRDRGIAVRSALGGDQ